MISLPPSERDLHAYVDHQLLDSDRRVLETWLASHPEVAAQVQAWQQDAQLLRASLSGALQQPHNPALDPALIRQRIKKQSRRHLATAALLLIAVSLGGFGGWHAREATQPPLLPMTDAMQAYRLFAQDGIMPADYNAQDRGTMQAWLDRYFNQAHRLPRPQPSRLQAGQRAPAHHRPRRGSHGAVPGRPRPAHQLLYPPAGPNNGFLPRGSRSADGLQADYWSGGGYNYAMVSPVDQAAALQTQF